MARGVAQVQACVVPPVAAHAQVIRGGGHKLPQPRRASMGAGEGIEGALDQRQQGQFDGKLASLDLGDQIVEVAPGARGDQFEIARLAEVILAGRADLHVVQPVQAQLTADALPHVPGHLGSRVGWR